MNRFLIYAAYVAVFAMVLASCKDEEDNVIPITGISVSSLSQYFSDGQLDLSMGQSATLAATLLPENHNETGNNTLVWSSSDVLVATVTAGTVFAVGVGDAVITVALERDPSIKKDVPVHVEAAEVISVTGIGVSSLSDYFVNGNLVDMPEGASAALTTTLLPEDHNEVVNNTLVWSSSDEDVATVMDGIVFAVGGGDAVITVALERNPSIKKDVSVHVITAINITALKLDNYEVPFTYTDMMHDNRGWKIDDWTVTSILASNGNVFTGGFSGWSPEHPERYEEPVLAIIGYASWPSGNNFSNEKIYQTVQLEPGTYRFSAFVFASWVETNIVYVAAALGDDLPNVEQLEQQGGLASALIPHDINKSLAGYEFPLYFSLSQTETVSLGLVATFESNGEVYFSKVELWKYE